MRTKLGFIAFFAPFVLFSQGSRFLTFDGGASVNKPTDTHYFEKPGGMFYTTPWIGSTKTTASYFFKFGFEKPITLCEKTSVSFPVTISYRKQIDAVHVSGYTNGDWAANMYLSQDRAIENHFLFASVGVKFSANLCHRFSLFTQGNLNIGTSVYSVLKYNGRVIDERPFAGFPLNLSVGGGIMYKVSDNISVGLTNEVYFYTIDDIAHPSVDKRLFNFGYNKRAAIINTGLRLQYKF